MSCPTCKDSILNQTPSSIPNSKCNGDCPPEITCLDIQPSSCVFYSGANLTCSGINYGDTLSVAFSKINTILCETSGCKVKVSADDCGCGYLESKITAGVGITITKRTANPSNCQDLLISTNPETLVWHDLQLANSYETKSDTYGMYQKPQYSDKDALGRVWFRGSFTKKVGYTLAGGNVEGVLSTALPANSRPLFVRTSLNGRCNGNGSQPQTLQLHILTNGVFSIKNYSNTVFENKGVFTLDGLWIDTNA